MKSKFTNKIKFTYYDLEDNIAVESVWADKEGSYYRIKNIPFFAPNIAYDDLVSAEKDEGELFFEGIIEESGNSTVQIILFDSDNLGELTKKIESFSCGWEGSHLKEYISVNIPKDISYPPIKNFLDEQAKKGILDYKEACLAHNI